MALGTIIQVANATTAVNQAFVDVPISATQAGDCLIALAADASSLTVTGVTDAAGAGTAFTQATGAAGSDGTNRTDAWHLLSVAAGKTNVRITFSAASAVEKSGVVVVYRPPPGTTLTFGVAASVANNTGTVSPNIATGARVTPTAPGIVVGIVNGTGQYNVTASPTPGNEFTSAAGVIITGGTLHAGACFLLHESLGPHVPAWSTDGSNANSLASTAAYYATPPATRTTYKLMAWQQR